MTGSRTKNHSLSHGKITNKPKLSEEFTFVTKVRNTIVVMILMSFSYFIFSTIIL